MITSRLLRRTHLAGLIKQVERALHKHRGLKHAGFVFLLVKRLKRSVHQQIRSVARTGYRCQARPMAKEC